MRKTRDAIEVPADEAEPGRGVADGVPLVRARLGPLVVLGNSIGIRACTPYVREPRKVHPTQAPEFPFTRLRRRHSPFARRQQDAVQAALNQRCLTAIAALHAQLPVVVACTNHARGWRVKE
jgi:hypothetical protein